jgi:hypothetical protein
MIKREPPVIPAEPTPEMARPAMKTLELGAAADIRLPTSKRKTLPINTRFTGKSM